MRMNFISTSSLVKHSMTTGVVSLIVSVVCVSSPSSAQVINGGFETGDFTGFGTIGDTSIQTAAFGSGPTQGISQALITNGTGPGTRSGNSSVPTASLETFLELTPGSLQSTGAIEGSAISQTFTANTGDVLTFDFNFLTNETVAPISNDFSFVTFNGSVVTLANVFSPASASNVVLTGFEQETGFQTRSFTISTSGAFTLGFGVVDAGLDETVDSALLLDNINITPQPIPPIVPEPIPEPSSIFGLLTFGIFGAGALLKSKRGQAKN